jgi:hypothetical protein
MDKDLGKAFEAMLEAETRLDQALRNGDIQPFLADNFTVESSVWGSALLMDPDPDPDPTPIRFFSSVTLRMQKKIFFFLIVFSYIFRDEAGSSAQAWGHPVFPCRKDYLLLKVSVLGIRLTNGSGSGSNSNPIIFFSDFKDAKKILFIVFSFNL